MQFTNGKTRGREKEALYEDERGGKTDSLPTNPHKITCLHNRCYLLRCTTVMQRCIKITVEEK